MFVASTLAFSLLGLACAQSRNVGPKTPTSKRAQDFHVKRDSWGAAWSTGPAQDGNSLNYVSYNYIPGAPPQPGEDYLFLWLGISNGTGDLIQAGVDGYNDNSWCGATQEQWCASASVFGATGQTDGPYGVVDATENIKVVYERLSDASGWYQYVYDGSGNLFSSLFSASGPMLGLGTGTECDSDCTGSTSYQIYSNLEFIFDEADPDYIDTLGVGAGVQYTELTTADGGITWTVEEIIIPPMIAGAPTTTLGGVTSSSVKTTTTSKASTTATMATTATTSSGTCASLYAQCGGDGYTGPTTCCSGSTCTYSNTYYSQCLTE